jgi:NADH-quinone oxidoreductase subunit K
MVSLNAYLIVSAAMFIIGALGVVARRNAMIVFLSIELMLNSVNLTLVAFSAYLGDATGQVLVFFVMTLAAAEAAVGLALVITIFRRKKTINLDEINIMKW